MTPLRDALPRGSPTIFPDDTHCPGCGYFDIADQRVQQIMEAAGKKLWLAQRPHWKECDLGAGCRSRRSAALRLVQPSEGGA